MWVMRLQVSYLQLWALSRGILATMMTTSTSLLHVAAEIAPNVADTVQQVTADEEGHCESHHLDIFLHVLSVG